MAPISLMFGPLLRRASFDFGLPSTEFSSQWTNPGDVFSVLLILGGDVVARALAQVAGTGLTPVTFSFGSLTIRFMRFVIHLTYFVGWVAYAVTAVVSAVGENRLMPLPDCACKIINGDSAYVRDNTSWVLGRIVRDFESWMAPAVRDEVSKILDQKVEKMRNDAEKKKREEREHEKDEKDEENPGSKEQIQRPTQAGLCVSFYKAKKTEPGKVYLDTVYWSGFVTALFQLGIAAIPCGIWGDWSILLITAAGILLAFLSGSLTQWKTEKWSCRPNMKPKTVVLTRGNGAQHAIVIRDPDSVGLDLESLAAGQTNVDVSTSLSTRAIVVLLAALWILLLISASGIQDHTWFLLAVGGIGIVQNIFVAGWRRNPSAFGIPLEYEKVIARTKIMDALFAVEKSYPGLGISMRETFFPGGQLKDHEVQMWEACERVLKDERDAKEAARKKAKEEKKRAEEEKRKANEGMKEAQDQPQRVNQA